MSYSDRQDTRDQESDQNTGERSRRDALSGLNPETTRRPFLKLLGAGAGAALLGNTLVERASAADGDHEGVQVDFVTGFAPNEDLSATTYSSEGRLVNWEWGERYGNTGEDMNKEPKSATCDVTTDSGVEFDFSNNAATVNYNLSACGGSDQDLLLVSYDSPISDRNNPGWDPATASDQSIYDYAYVSTQSDGSLTVDVPATDVPTSVTNHWRVNEGSGLTLGDAVGSLDATASSPTNLSWNTEAGLDGAHLQSSADTASGADLGSDSTTALSHFLAGDGTIGARVYLESGELSSRRAIFSSGSNADNHVYLGTAGNGSELNFSVSANCCSLAVDLNFGSSAFTEGTWHSVVVTAERNGTDDADVTAYIDGTQVATTTYGATNSSANLTNSAQIGTDPGVSNTTWVGRLDDVWVSDVLAANVGRWHDATRNNYPPSGTNLAAYYALDGSTATNAITGADAATNGSPSSGAAGIRNDAFSFDTATDDGLGSGQNLSLNDGQGTVAGWVYVTGHDSFGRLFQVGGSFTSFPDTGWQVRFAGGNDNILIETRAGSDLSEIAKTPPLDRGRWYFVVGVMDQGGSPVGRIHLFDRDGELDGSPWTGDPANWTTSSSDPLFLMAGGNTEYTSGRMDEVYAYPTALSESEITDLYRSSVPIVNTPPRGSLEASYTLDGSTATNSVTSTDATTNDSPSPGAAGVAADAFSFDGTDDGLASGNSLPINGSQATVAAWLYHGGHESYGRVFQVGGTFTSTPGSADGGYNVEFNGSSDDLRLLNWTSSDTLTEIGTFTLPTGKWYFLVAVEDGDNARYHVFDRYGELPGSPKTASGSRTQSGSETLHLMMGDGSNTAGRMDEVRAYSRPLSEIEVRRLYQATQDQVGPVRKTSYGQNLNGGAQVTIDGLAYSNVAAPGVRLRGKNGTDSTGDSIDTSNVANDVDALYQTQWFGNGMEFEVEVLPGTYDVTIHYAELFYTDSTGDRIQDVFVQGNLVEENLDVFEAVGSDDTAYSTEVTGVTVKDGTLTISTAPGDNAGDTNQIVSGFEIQKS
jgi:hypothetical protein